MYTFSLASTFRSYTLSSRMTGSPASALIQYAASMRSRRFASSHSHAVVVAGLLVRREGEDHIPVERDPFPLEPDQRLDEDGGPVLDVARAPAVEVAVLLGQHERLQRPVLPQRLHHVEMGQQQDRLPRAGPAEPDHQVLLERVRARRSRRPWRESPPPGTAAPAPATAAGGAVGLRRVDRRSARRRWRGPRDRPGDVWPASTVGRTSGETDQEERAHGGAGAEAKRHGKSHPGRGRNNIRRSPVW